MKKSIINKETILFVIVNIVITVITSILMHNFANISIAISKSKLEHWYFIFSIAGVFATLAAVGVAIWIPKRIADRQDKIALFEKRYELYFRYKILLKSANDVISTDFEKFKHLDLCNIWVAFLDVLIPDVNLIENFQKNYTNKDKAATLPSFNTVVENEIFYYNLELDKISYLFDFDDDSIKKLNLIKSKLIDSKVEPTSNFENTVLGYRTIAQLIINSEFDEIMRNQLKL